MSAAVETAPFGRGFGRSVLAIGGALVFNVTLTTAIDEVFHLLGVYPPWGDPMPDPGDNALALGYRLVVGVASGWIAARLAPNSPTGHGIVLGAIGTLLSIAGIFAAMKMPLGPIWYPVALAISALPTAYFGAKLQARRGRTDNGIAS